ncbi:ATP-dependent DNA ligase [Pseudomonas phage vB_PpuM-Roomu-2]|uniref:DNA ligase n=1 Tax=Pseudomonas phage vB_PpuM-Roomu-2 TaxID=3132621 RepID=A0AAX4MYH8_9CAUD
MVSFTKSLYGLEKGGKYKVWHIHASDLGDHSELIISHGQEGGKLTTGKPDVFTAGNQGRTHYEQAVFEAQARIKKQLDKNYRETKEELTDLPVLAMLSKDHTKDGKAETVEKGVYTSDKLDGVRCLAKCTESGIVLESRTGQPYDVPHIVKELRQFMKPGDILDGELYVHGPSLQEITSAVKRVDSEEKRDKLYLKAAKLQAAGGEKYEKAYADYKEAQAIHEIREALEFHVFDIAVMDTPFSERYELLQNYAACNFLDGGCIVEVKYRFAISIEELNKQLKDCIDRGFEGIMYRTQDGMYESGKRSAGLWKYKLFFDEEFYICDVTVDKQGYAVFELLNNVGGTSANVFNCVLGDYNWRQEAAKKKELYIGKWMTVQYQSRYKGTLLPQFPTGKLIREGSVVDGKFIPSE